ncbi:hypothetical protein O181_028753 [Austropuccinia psidii MF-1]|uniref:Uncharacterized protein n=1 Tax=Austropuccinia psidii MF-1 TaxID=1389203 RepID=A0A9Q3H248_9BASI|nr:hypothetical protein [Austropuccinia psidii MF-1]
MIKPITIQLSAQPISPLNYHHSVQCSTHNSFEEGEERPSASTTEPMQKEDAVNKSNPSQNNPQDFSSSIGQQHNPSSTGEPMQTDDSANHSNQRKTHHQNFPGPSGKR